MSSKFFIQVGEAQCECRLTLKIGREFQDRFERIFGRKVNVLAWIDGPIGEKPPEELALFYSVASEGKFAYEDILENMDYASVVAAQAALTESIASSIPEELKKKKDQMLQKAIEAQAEKLVDRIMKGVEDQKSSPT